MVVDFVVVVLVVMGRSVLLVVRSLSVVLAAVTVLIVVEVISSVEPADPVISVEISSAKVLVRIVLVIVLSLLVVVVRGNGLHTPTGHNPLLPKQFFEQHSSSIEQRSYQSARQLVSSNTILSGVVDVVPIVGVGFGLQMPYIQPPDRL